MLNRSGYTPIVHCNNVRQAARVIMMHEKNLPDPWTARDVSQVTGLDLRSALSAASLLQATTPELSEEEVSLTPEVSALLHRCT